MVPNSLTNSLDRLARFLELLMTHSSILILSKLAIRWVKERKDETNRSRWLILLVEVEVVVGWKHRGIEGAVSLDWIFQAGMGFTWDKTMLWKSVELAVGGRRSYLVVEHDRCLMLKSCRALWWTIALRIELVDVLDELRLERSFISKVANVDTWRVDK